MFDIFDDNYFASEVLAITSDEERTHDCKFIPCPLASEMKILPSSIFGIPSTKSLYQVFTNARAVSCKKPFRCETEKCVLVANATGPEQS